MGNDGGSIPDRRDLVRNKPKAEQADKANQVRARWGFCALSKKSLQEPVVSCRLGRLYNKDAIIEHLLDKTAYGDAKDICGHIKSLKDVKTLNLTRNPIINSKSSDTERPVALFVCPLTMKEMNGAVPFVYLMPCGCVFSQAGLKTLTTLPKDNGETSEVKEKNLCPQCAAKYDQVEDIFLINPGAEDEQKMMDRLVSFTLCNLKSNTKKRKATAETEGSVLNSSPRLRNKEASVKRSRKLEDSMVELEAKRRANMTDAVKSIYQGKGDAIKSNWISQGTFTRYAA